MRVGLVVDSSCDLPKPFLEQNDIEILPITIRVDGDELVDRHDEAAALEFYRGHIGEKGHRAESAAFTTDQIRDLFLNRLVAEYDFVFCQTVMKSRSPIFENATKASFTILSGYQQVRKAAGAEGPFALRVVNTGTLFTGQGVLAAETVRLIGQGLSPNEIRMRVEELIPCVRAYAIPPDLYYVRARARKKGDRSVSLFGAALGSALDIQPILCGYDDETRPVAKVRGFNEAVTRLFGYASARVRKGLLAPYVCVSYAGELEALDAMVGFGELQSACRETGVELMISVMSVTGGVNLGPGTLTLGLLAEPHDFS